jgi:hypothetical protein
MRVETAVRRAASGGGLCRARLCAGVRGRGPGRSSAHLADHADLAGDGSDRDDDAAAASTAVAAPSALAASSAAAASSAFAGRTARSTCTARATCRAAPCRPTGRSERPPATGTRSGSAGERRFSASGVGRRRCGPGHRRELRCRRTAVGRRAGTGIDHVFIRVARRSATGFAHTLLDARPGGQARDHALLPSRTTGEGRASRARPEPKLRRRGQATASRPPWAEPGPLLGAPPRPPPRPWRLHDRGGRRARRSSAPRRDDRDRDRFSATSPVEGGALGAGRRLVRLEAQPEPRESRPAARRHGSRRPSDRLGSGPQASGHRCARRRDSASDLASARLAPERAARHGSGRPDLRPDRARGGHPARLRDPLPQGDLEPVTRREEREPGGAFSFTSSSMAA